MEGKNPLMDAVAEVSILPRGKTAEEKELDRMRGEKVADDWHDDPRLQEQSMVLADPEQGVEASNPPGSFEALMGGWGSSARRAFNTEGHAPA